MNNSASVTSLMSAFVRAYHSLNAQNPIFDDVVARKLISDEEYLGMQAYVKGGLDFFAPEKQGSFATDSDALKWIVNTQLAPTVLARSRFCEDSLKTAAMTGTKQYVLLGAGLDTFAWRSTELMKKLEVFEVDHPATQADKIKRIERAKLEIPKNLHFVPVDFTVDNLLQSLKQQGFNPAEKTFFGWLGVSYYLTGEQVEDLLDNIASFAAEGSTLLFDFADSGLFSSEVRRVQNMLAMAQAGGESMKFCIEPFELSALLEKHGFLIYEMLEPEDIDSAYFHLRADGLCAFEHISYALAVIKATGLINTKEKILHTALRLFAKYGYTAVSVRDIASHLGISQAALYKHYKNKRDIFDSIVSRMELEDAERAQLFGVPSQPLENIRDEYASADIEKIKSFSMAQFLYWTQNAFASDFRRMLTLEQYTTPEMSALYKQYVSDGILSYMEDVFRESGFTRFGNSDSHSLALEFYAPLYMLIGLHDSAADSREIVLQAKKHIDEFFKN